ncbi:MAG: hypothetical protein C4542_05525 [Dehalococcoidia bacterium]|nr:MAG: hypothetical protein C4542_05525 [Dehalococcoidia bacterium]
MTWSKNALKVWQRYLAENETPEQRLHTVASIIAQAEIKYGASNNTVETVTERFYNLMINKKFLPNSPTLRNIGRSKKLSRAACFVIPIEDSMEQIFSALKTAALIQQFGGGVGANFGQLRPKDDLISSTGGKSSGPVGFMHVFDAAAEEIKQGGVRRGAWMFSLDVCHPDVEEFIKTEFKNANTSVMVDDVFMKKALKADVDSNMFYINPRNMSSPGAFDASELLKKIATRAWQRGNPGLLFYDQINQDNMIPSLGPITATNPCGEQPLHPNNACNLGSINLSMYWDKNNHLLLKNDLYQDAMTATRFLNNVQVPEQRY